MYSVIKSKYKYDFTCIHVNGRRLPAVIVVVCTFVFRLMISIIFYNYFENKFSPRDDFPGMVCDTRGTGEKRWARGLAVSTILFFIIIYLLQTYILVYMCMCVFYHCTDELYPHHVRGSRTRNGEIIIRPLRFVPASNWIRSTNHVVSKPNVRTKFAQRPENSLMALVRLQCIDYLPSHRSTLFVPKYCDPR